jgi:hypothetical protein
VNHRIGVMFVSIPAKACCACPCLSCVTLVDLMCVLFLCTRAAYLCEWLRARLLTLDIHGGTKEDEIVAVFQRAKQIIASGAWAVR